jgi:hypothetical protein
VGYLGQEIGDTVADGGAFVGEVAPVRGQEEAREAQPAGVENDGHPFDGALAGLRQGEVRLDVDLVSSAGGVASAGRLRASGRSTEIPMQAEDTYGS